MYVRSPLPQSFLNDINNAITALPGPFADPILEAVFVFLYCKTQNSYYLILLEGEALRDAYHLVMITCEDLAFSEAMTISISFPSHLRKSSNINTFMDHDGARSGFAQQGKLHDHILPGTFFEMLLSFHRRNI